MENNLPSKTMAAIRALTPVHRFDCLFLISNSFLSTFWVLADPSVIFVSIKRWKYTTLSCEKETLCQHFAATLPLWNTPSMNIHKYFSYIGLSLWFPTWCDISLTISHDKPAFLQIVSLLYIREYVLYIIILSKKTLLLPVWTLVNFFFRNLYSSKLLTKCNNTFWQKIISLSAWRF